MMNKIGTVLEKLTMIFATISVIAIAFMMFGICIDVFTRWFSGGGKSIRGIYELVEVAMAMGVFGAFSYTQYKHAHVHVTLLIQYYPQKPKMLSYAITSLITTVVMFAVSYAAYSQAMMATKTGQITNVLRIPMTGFYLFECVAMAFFGLALLYDTVRCFIAVFDRKVADDIQSTWT